MKLPYERAVQVEKIDLGVNNCGSNALVGDPMSIGKHAARSSPILKASTIKTSRTETNRKTGGRLIAPKSSDYEQSASHTVDSQRFERLTLSNAYSRSRPLSHTVSSSLCQGPTSSAVFIPPNDIANQLDTNLLRKHEMTSFLISSKCEIPIQLTAEPVVLRKEAIPVPLTPVTRRPRKTHEGCSTILYRRQNAADLSGRRVHFCVYPGE